MGVKYERFALPPTHRWIDTLLTPTPYMRKSDDFRRPLEAISRARWPIEMRLRAGMRFARWSLTGGLCIGVIIVVVLTLQALSLTRTGWRFVAAVPLAGMFFCMARALQWVARMTNHAGGPEWRAKMTREAEERLARDDPERTW